MRSLEAAGVDVYAYTIDEKTVFKDLNMEQQAQVFQDRFLIANGKLPLKALNKASLATYDKVISQVKQ